MPTLAQDAQPPDAILLERQSEIGPESISELIASLGSAQFDVREQTMLKLVDLGERAIEECKQHVATTKDLELKTRLRSVIAYWEQKSQVARFDRFLKDKDPTQSHGLDCWPTLRDILGDGPIAKLVLVEIYRQQPRLAKAIALGQVDEIKKESLHSIQEIQFREMDGHWHTLGDTLALTLATIRCQGDGGSELESNALSRLRMAPFTEKSKESGWRKSLSKLVGQWALSLRRESMDDAVLFLCLQYDHPAATVIARELLSRPMNNPELYPIRVQGLIRFGNLQDVPLLESSLDDRTIARPNVPIINLDQESINLPFEFGNEKVGMGSVQVRDVALAGVLLLRQQTPREYFPRFKRNDLNGGFYLDSLAFPDDTSDRDAAFEKFRLSQPKLPLAPVRS